MRMVVFLMALLIPALACAAQQVDARKDARTEAQRKIDSQLLQEIERRADPSYQAGMEYRGGLQIDEQDRVLIDIRVEVTPATRKLVTDLEGVIVSTSPQYRSIVAWLPLAKVETLAEEEDVIAIVPAPKATLHDPGGSAPAAPPTRSLTGTP
jgi:hypothetical protein